MKLNASLYLGAISLAIAASSSAFAASLTLPSFREVNVDTNVVIGYGVTTADMNGDKAPDIVLADKNLIVWYENPSWKKHVIAQNLTQRDHVCIAAADIDGDGKAEVAVGAEWNPGDTVNSGSVHYLVAPGDRTKKWKEVRLPHEPTVHRMRWVKARDGKYDLVVVPLHGRGNKNEQGDGVKIFAYRMPADVEQPWKLELIDDSLHKTHNFDPVQWDSDPEYELLVAAKEGVFLFDKQGDRWTKTQLGGPAPGETGYLGAGEIRLGKLPGGKRFIVTIEPMHGNQLVLYTEPQGGANGKLWTRRVLDESLADGHALACGDLAHAGFDQVVVGWRAMMNPGAKVGVRVYAPLDSEGKDWQKQMVDDNTMACEDLCLADLNGDGHLDIIAAGRATKNLKIYFNEGKK